MLAGGRERARAGGDRGIEWRVTITRPRVDVQGPGGDRPGRSRSRPKQRSRRSASWATRPGWRGRSWSSRTFTGARAPSRAATRRRQAADYARRVGNRARSGGRLGRNALCAINGPLPVAEGLEWLEQLLQPSRRTGPSTRTCRVRHRARGNERPLELARLHIADTRALANDLGLRWRGAVQGLLSGYVELLAGDPVAAERDMRAADRAFREIGEGGSLHRRGRSAARRVRAGAL